MVCSLTVPVVVQTPTYDTSLQDDRDKSNEEPGAWGPCVRVRFKMSPFKHALIRAVVVTAYVNHACCFVRSPPTTFFLL